MRVIQVVFIFLICAIITDAQQKNVQQRESRIGMKTAFVKLYNKINTLVHTKQWKELNRYVHPGYGIYILDNPGVRPVPTNVSRFDDLTNSDRNKNEIIAQKLRKLKAGQKYKLKFSSVPVWDCGTDRWSKKGSYCEDISSFPELSEHLLYSSICNEDVTHPAVVKAREFGKFIKRHVLQTSGFDLYFAFIDGKWYIAVIDLCDKCSA